MIDNPDYKGTGIDVPFILFTQCCGPDPYVLCLLDPDPLFSCTDPDLGPSIIKKK
jgi:hypothetical protein